MDCIARNPGTMAVQNEKMFANRNYADTGGARARWFSEMNVSETKGSSRLRALTICGTVAIPTHTQASTKAVAATIHIAQVSGLCDPDCPDVSQWSRCRLCTVGTIRTPTTNSTTPTNANSLLISGRTIADSSWQNNSQVGSLDIRMRAISGKRLYQGAVPLRRDDYKNDDGRSHLPALRVL